MLVANCMSCGDEHPLGDRPVTDMGSTTKCPACGDRPYGSEPTGDGVVKPESERIADAIGDVHGVGEGTLENIRATFSLLAELERATAEQLQTIDGVGEKTAEGIVEAVR